MVEPDRDDAEREQHDDPHRALTDPSQWSDWNGQPGNSSAPVTAAFNAAVAKVDTIGLSFGGGCFFENGVTTNDGSGTFALTAFSD